MNSQFRVGLPASLPHPTPAEKSKRHFEGSLLDCAVPVVDWGSDGLSVGVCNNLDIPQPMHITKDLDEVVTEVVRRDVKCAQVDERSDG